MRRLRRAHQKHVREQAKRYKRLKQRALAAGTAAAITLGAGAGINKALAAYTPDNHQLSVSQDADGDLLANKEEMAIGYRPFKADQNRNEIPDGVELSKRCAAVVEQLPFGPDPADPNKTYIEHQPAYGLEQCDMCETIVNMGPAWIVNPQLGITVECPLIAMHYLQHGSFGYGGDVHNGRVDVPALLRALEIQYTYLYDPNEHQLPIDGNDLDDDLLTDDEELAAGFNFYDADQDNDLIPDGIELAKQCAEVVNQLPWKDDALPGETYKWCDFQKGLETCDICGATVNMGPAGIVNPKLGLEVDCLLIAIHYMEHGSFSHAGDVHGHGRIDVPGLLKVLEMPQRCGDLGTMYLPGDLNEDCKADLADFGEFADKWLGSTEPNQDENIGPGITYQVDECDEGAELIPPVDANSGELRFSVRAEGSYVYFKDLIRANCCPDKIELEMTREDNLITVYEKEYLGLPCDCICDFPTTATLGPFENGTYTLVVYEQREIQDGQPLWVNFIGSTTVTIGLGQ